MADENAVTVPTMRFPAILLVLFLSWLPATPAGAFSNAQLIDGFLRTVFGSEYPRKGWEGDLVKKFTRPVRLYVDDRSARRRGAEVAAFVQTLPPLITGLDIATVSDPAKANFRVLVLDRADYRLVVSREVFGRQTSSYAPGKCMVRVVSSTSGILRSDAAIVADNGDYLFRRCLVEEVLQGLGPVNDDWRLSESVFNDRSRHSTFTSFDRHILNMLYHPLIRPGMTIDEAKAVLPTIAAEVRARLQ